MNDRFSKVNNININVIVFGSILQIGDSIKLSPKANILAEQFVYPIYNEKNEHKYEQFPIFSRFIPQPVITENIQMNIINKNKVINVNNLEILGMSASAIVQIGSNIMMNPEARVKHIRHLHYNPYQN